MAITSGQLVLLKSTSLLGGVVTGTAVTSALLQDVFTDISGDDAAAGVTKYACVYLKNTHGSLTLTAVKQWLLSNTPSGFTVVTIGIGTSAVNGTEQTIANINTAPAGVTFSAAATEGAAIAISDLAPAATQAIWFRLIVSAGASATALDNFVVRTKGDTPA